MRFFVGLCFVWAMFMGSVAFSAPLPKSVADEYKAYQTALINKDKEGALKHGYAAWQAAEKTLGDSKTTGDLAYNYGSIVITSGHGYTKSGILKWSKVHRKKGKALVRSVELAQYYSEDIAVDIELDRRIRLVEHGLL